MGEVWPQVPLGELCDVSRGGSPRPIHEWIQPSGIPWVKISDATSNDSRFISRTKEFIRPEGLSKSVAVEPGDLIVSNSATPGIPRFLRIDAAIHDGWLLLRNFRGLDKEYCFYVIKHERKNIVREGNGSIFTNLKTEILRSYPIPVPPLPEQEAIAKILGALDDKVELNRKMNAALDELNRTIFRSWFVDFDPVRAKMEGHEPFGMDADIAALFPDRLVDSPLGPIPEGWDVNTLGDIVQVVDCLHSKKPERQPEGRLLLQLANIRDDGLLDMADQYLISEEDYAKWVSRIEVSEGDCVITNVGRVGAVSQVPDGVRAALGRNMTGLRSKEPFQHPTFVISCLLSNAMREEIQRHMDVGTILSALNVRNIPKLRFVRPTTQVTQAFEAEASPFRKMMEHNQEESRTLAHLRDALLPELISGRIRVPDAEKLASEVV